MIHAHQPNVFAGSPLDRLDHRRKDADWVREALSAPDASFLPVWRGRNLVQGGRGAPVAGLLAADIARAHLAAAPWAMLGVRHRSPVFTLDVSRMDVPPAPADGRYDDLRRVGGVLPGEDASILAHARGLMHWRTRAGFCGVCGAACTPRDAGHVMACGGCGASHFPRTDPAVIMLVTSRAGGEERALLGHPARFREMRLFTTLAGFVEPGESLEEAVVREVWEEAGLRVGNVAYSSSQPWPFPSSIMLGFKAEAETQDISIDQDELLDARWFTRSELIAAEGFVMPPDLSIARRLIDAWIKAGA